MHNLFFVSGGTTFSLHQGKNVREKHQNLSTIKVSGGRDLSVSTNKKMEGKKSKNV